MSVLLTNEEKIAAKEIGGKAKNLLKLEAMGCNVPKWAVIPQNILLNQLSNAGDLDKIRQEFNDLIVPDIESLLANYFGADYQTRTYAVRSSASDEDGVQFSFAGQFETFLHVPFHQLAEKTIAIWQSVISGRVVKYREENNLPLQLGINVIIQEMIPAAVSGVAFGMHPVSGNLENKVISSVYGLGEGLVSGQLNADTYTIAPENTTQQIIKKTHAFVKAIDGGIEKITIPTEKQELSSLQENQLKEITQLLDRLTEKLGAPQDVEFAFYQDQLYLLQTRPITTTNRPDGEYILWDNSNIIESYPGITTPLTFSFIIKMYEMVYRQFVGILGVTESEIEQRSNIFANTLGLVRGRVYYNLLSWYKMLAMVPGYSINAEFMEKMMGVKERFELKEDFRMSKGLARFRIFKMIFKMIQLQRRLPKERKQFKIQLDEIMDNYQSIDFKKLPTKEIIDHYIFFEKTLLLKWKAPLINDFFAMIWFGLLEKQVVKLCPNESNIHNNLLCGSQDIISVEPIHKSIALSNLILQKEETKQFFLEHTAESIWESLNNGSYPAIKQAFDSYIHRFGDRCVGELKLETISYKQAPHLFVKVIKSYVEQGITEATTTHNIEEELRTTAEQKMDLALKGKPFKKWGFNYILKKVRDLVSNRENLRYERTRGFGMVRNMFSALGEQWQKEGKLENARDVFYMELEEIKSGMLNQDILTKITARKKEFESYKKQPAPQERFYTYGNNFTDEYIYSNEKLPEITGDLSGIGCCPGRIQGKVRIVNHPDEIESLNGDILVTSSTDPGWVTLFPTASAIVVERGSLLSHSAIVSREMGIPCIVSVTGLLRTLKTGDEIIMDGSTGDIKIIEK